MGRCSAKVWHLLSFDVYIEQVSSAAFFHVRTRRVSLYTQLSCVCVAFIQMHVFISISRVQYFCSLTKCFIRQNKGYAHRGDARIRTYTSASKCTERKIRVPKRKKGLRTWWQNVIKSVRAFVTPYRLVFSFVNVFPPAAFVYTYICTRIVYDEELLRPT